MFELLSNLYTVAAPTIYMSVIIAPFIFGKYLFSDNNNNNNNTKKESAYVDVTIDLSKLNATVAHIKTNRSKTKVRVLLKCRDVQGLLTKIDSVNGMF